MRSHGNSIELNNTNGKQVVVHADQLVYMRGKGNFGIYGDMRDAHRKSQGYDPSSHAGKVGTSSTHRHEQDLHGSKGVPKAIPFAGRIDTLDKLRILKRQIKPVSMQSMLS